MPFPDRQRNPQQQTNNNDDNKFSDRVKNAREWEQERNPQNAVTMRMTTMKHHKNTSTVIVGSGGGRRRRYDRQRPRQSSLIWLRTSLKWSIGIASAYMLTFSLWFLWFAELPRHTELFPTKPSLLKRQQQQQQQTLPQPIGYKQDEEEQHEKPNLLSSFDKNYDKKPKLVVFPHYNSQTQVKDHSKLPYQPDYNGLELNLEQRQQQQQQQQRQHIKTRYSPFERNIQSSDNRLYGRYRDKLLKEMNKKDLGLPKRLFYHDEELEEDPPQQQSCYRPNWKSKFYPVCNTFHEQDVVEDIQNQLLFYRGSGHFRDTWVVTNHGYTNIWVLKTARLTIPFGIATMTNMAKEAIIMERLTSSPYIVDTYGFCGFNTFVENMRYEVEDEIHSQLRRDEVQKLFQTASWKYPLNNLTSVEKLDVALVVAKSLAAIHGYKGGVIIHADTHPVQWLRNARGEIKLNDFNNALILDWNYTSTSTADAGAYCQEFHNLPGTFRAPEEHLGLWTVDHRSDVYSMGGMIYTVLTGLYPFWEYHMEERHAKIRNGELPDLDPRYRDETLYPIEAKLVAVMEDCFAYRIDDRPEIFRIVTRLEQILNETSS